MTEALLKAEEAARLLSLHVETVKLMAREGRIPAVKIGNRWRFDPAKIRDWLDGRAADGQARMGL